MHYYQHNIGDYARDTGHLSVLEHGIYRLLLDWCYLNEKPLPTEQAMRVGRGNPTETQSVLSEFFQHTDAGWEHRRVMAEVAAYHAKATVNRQNGAKGGRPKTQNNPVGFQPLTDWGAKHNPNQEPITKNQEPVIKEDKPPRKRSAALTCPGDVDPQTWSDWQSLRKAKRAPVTETVLAGARREADKAGMTLEAFLQVWCRRGSQGLEADWLKPHERTGSRSGGKYDAAAAAIFDGLPDGAQPFFGDTFDA
jgi:uncharacterized protein YdaU (DUF1376 family)